MTEWIPFFLLSLLLIGSNLNIRKELAKDETLDNKKLSGKNSYLAFKIKIIDKESVSRSKKFVSLDIRFLKDHNYYYAYYNFIDEYLPNFEANWFNIYYSENSFVPEEIRIQPTKFFYPNCEYIIPIPIGTYLIYFNTSKNIFNGKKNYSRVIIKENSLLKAELNFNENTDLKSIALTEYEYDKENTLPKKCIIDQPNNLKENE